MSKKRGLVSINGTKGIWIIRIVFPIVGLGFFIGSFFLAKEVYFPDYEPVEIVGTISDIKISHSGSGKNRTTKHNVYVDYTYGHYEYKHVNYGYYKAGMRENDSVPIKLNPAKPGEPKSAEGETFGFIMLLFFGLVFTGVGIGFNVYEARKKIVNRGNELL